MRKAYRHVLRPLYRRGRRAVLQSSLQRPWICAAAHLRAQHEAAARRNREEAVRKLAR